MGCINCGGAAKTSGAFSFVGNNTFRGVNNKKCPVSGASFYQVTFDGETKVLNEGDFGQPFELSGVQFVLSGSFLRSQIHSLEGGTFPLLVEIVLQNGCNQILRSAFRISLTAVYVSPVEVVDAIESAPEEIQERSIPRKRKTRKKKGVSGMVLDKEDNEKPKIYFERDEPEEIEENE